MNTAERIVSEHNAPTSLGQARSGQVVSRDGTVIA
jgi:hypothetical protein